MQRRTLLALGFALASAAILAAAGGGWAFLKRPVGEVFIGLWLVWWGVLILGRRSGRPSQAICDQWLAVATGAGMLLTTLLLVPWEYSHVSGPLPRDGALAWAGLALFAAGIGVQVTAFTELGALFAARSGSPHGPRLVTNGLYRIVRHPVYLGYLMTFTGMALGLSSLVGLGLTGVIGVLVVRRIQEEEVVLDTMFQDAYDTYRTRTHWRLVPGLY